MPSISSFRYSPMWTQNHPDPEGPRRWFLDAPEANVMKRLARTRAALGAGRRERRAAPNHPPFRRIGMGCRHSGRRVPAP